MTNTIGYAYKFAPWGDNEVVEAAVRLPVTCDFYDWFRERYPTAEFNLIGHWFTDPDLA